jgi:hypothetical protein
MAVKSNINIQLLYTLGTFSTAVILYISELVFDTDNITRWEFSDIKTTKTAHVGHKRRDEHRSTAGLGYMLYLLLKILLWL